MKITRTSIFTLNILFFLTALTAATFLNSCRGKVDLTYKLTGNVEVDGQNLVKLKCAGCHSPVQINQLTKAVWINHTLPSMAKYLHIATYGGTQYYKSNPLDSSGISMENWNALVAYYEKLAPDSLPKAKVPAPLMNDWAGFSLKAPEKIPVSAYTTMVAFNQYNHKIYSSDATTERVYEWDQKLAPHAIIQDMPSPVVNALFSKDASGKSNAIFTCIGQIQSVDFPNGRVLGFNLDSAGVQHGLQLVASELARPVQTLAADFDKDGLTDLIILGQGHLKGGIYLMHQNKDKTYTQSTVSERPGAVQAVAGDFNNDGWPDLMVLFGSGDEGLSLFLNDHKGGFTSKDLLRFPPVYGSTSFQLADLDHDGKLDLIYTCGYNYHDSRIMKPYHGLYIFKNVGDWNFKQQWFYPINGCTKAIAADFDGHGNLDIATSAFFADLQHTPEEGFIYFEHDGPFNFKPHALPISKYGRWFSMDVCDFNNDGKPDIILGNYSGGFVIQQALKPFWEKNLPFVVLENVSKK